MKVWIVFDSQMNIVGVHADEESAKEVAQMIDTWTYKEYEVSE